jgi:hypothetical protein
MRIFRLAPLLAVSAVCWTLTAQAASVVITDSRFLTSATAVAGSAVDTQSGAASSAGLPLVTSANAYDASNFASGSGIGLAGLLSTNAEANSLTSFASATGTSSYSGSFAGGGSFNFQLDYSSLDATDTIAYSDSTLFFQLTSNGSTVASQFITANQLLSQTFTLAAGSANTFQLVLSSEAVTLTGGSAQNLASVAFQVTAVPEPTTWLLMAAGGLLIVATTRGRSPGTVRLA